MVWILQSNDVMVSTIAIVWFEAVRYCHRCVTDKYQTLTTVIDRVLCGFFFIIFWYLSVIFIWSRFDHFLISLIIKSNLVPIYCRLSDGSSRLSWLIGCGLMITVHQKHPTSIGSLGTPVTYVNNDYPPWAFQRALSQALKEFSPCIHDFVTRRCHVESRRDVLTRVQTAPYSR